MIDAEATPAAPSDAAVKYRRSSLCLFVAITTSSLASGPALKDGYGFDSKRLFESVRGQVGLR